MTPLPHPRPVQRITKGALKAYSFSNEKRELLPKWISSFLSVAGHFSGGPLGSCLREISGVPMGLHNWGSGRDEEEGRADRNQSSDLGRLHSCL